MSKNIEKQKALQAAKAQIERQFGKGSLMCLGEGDVARDIEVTFLVVLLVWISP